MESVGGRVAGVESSGLLFKPVQAIWDFLKEAFFDLVKRILARDAGIMQIGIRSGPARASSRPPKTHRNRAFPSR